MEPLVAVGARIWSLGDAAEAVEVKLSLKGCQLRMPEVPGKHIAHESIVVPHHERIPPRQPTHDSRLLLLKHVHQLSRKRIRVSSLRGGGGGVGRIVRRGARGRPGRGAGGSPSAAPPRLGGLVRGGTVGGAAAARVGDRGSQGGEGGRGERPDGRADRDPSADGASRAAGRAAVTTDEIPPRVPRRRDVRSDVAVPLHIV
mmetsp:Transcript_13607/g.24632  ORF Transcript_13607/g.24632 Transcript_13607/m.24632 type:complete len:201 (-) Transcript_13607:64-666(-)